MIRITKRKIIYKLEYLITEKEGIDINMSAEEEIENNSDKCWYA